MSDDEVVEHGLEHEDARDRPRVVDEAHEVLGSYHLQLGAAAVAAVVVWVVAIQADYAIPAPWLLVVLATLLVLAFRPVTREPRLAQDVLRRWDDLRVDRALASSGVYADPRIEVAEGMADRIIRHPTSDARTRAAAGAMIRRLRRLLEDLRRTSYLTKVQLAQDRHELSRSTSDLQDLLDARVAEILGQLARLHRTVVLRDTSALERVLSDVEELVRELEAEREVERLLSDAERE